jgi:hypothetical protein
MLYSRLVAKRRVALEPIRRHAASPARPRKERVVAREAPVKQIDHIALRVDSIEPVYSFFSDTLGLPDTWPLAAYPLYSSVGLCAGNVDLEILRFRGAKGGASPAHSGASLYGIAFLSPNLVNSLAQLDRRRVRRSAPIPQTQVSRGGKRECLWTTVYLGGLIDQSLVMSLFSTGSKWLPQVFWSRAFASEAFGRSTVADILWKRMPQYGVAYLVEWGSGFLKDLRRRRESALASLRARDGGALGLRGVREIVVGVRDFDRTQKRWRELLAPAGPAATGVWELGKGLSLRLVHGPSNAIRALVLGVASLEQARAFLAEKKILGRASDSRLSIASAALHGLDIRLVE